MPLVVDGVTWGQANIDKNLYRVFKKNCAFFSLSHLSPLYCCKRYSMLSTKWAALFLVGLISQVLYKQYLHSSERERWENNENSSKKKHNFSWAPCNYMTILPLNVLIEMVPLVSTLPRTDPYLVFTVLIKNKNFDKKWTYYACMYICSCVIIYRDFFILWKLLTNWIMLTYYLYQKMRIDNRRKGIKSNNKTCQ